MDQKRLLVMIGMFAAIYTWIPTSLFMQTMAASMFQEKLVYSKKRDME